MNIAEIIRALREDSDKSQKEIAEILNISQRTYSDYETGRIRLPIESAVILARIYDVDMNYICGVSSIRKRFPGKSENII